MTAIHNAVKKNHYYLHEILNRTWVVLSQVYSEEDLKTMGLKDDLDWAAPHPKKYKKVKVHSLEASSLMKMKTWTTLRQALLRQPTQTTLALLHQLDNLQGR